MNSQADTRVLYDIKQRNQLRSITRDNNPHRRSHRSLSFTHSHAVPKQSYTIIYIVHCQKTAATSRAREMLGAANVATALANLHGSIVHVLTGATTVRISLEEYFASLIYFGAVDVRAASAIVELPPCCTLGGTSMVA